MDDDQTDQANADQWYVETLTGADGPYSTASIRHMLTKGKIGANTRIRRGSKGVWHPTCMTHLPGPAQSPTTLPASPKKSKPLALPWYGRPLGIGLIIANVVVVGAALVTLILLGAASSPSGEQGELVPAGGASGSPEKG